jgi:hypothetical protein
MVSWHWTDAWDGLRGLLVLLPCRTNPPALALRGGSQPIWTPSASQAPACHCSCLPDSVAQAGKPVLALPWRKRHCGARRTC